MICMKIVAQADKKEPFSRRGRNSPGIADFGLDTISCVRKGRQYMLEGILHVSKTWYIF
jgi:hypothetical protein